LAGTFNGVQHACSHVLVLQYAQCVGNERNELIIITVCANQGDARMITASQRYAYVQFPHPVLLDEYGDLTRPDESDAFVELLWEQDVEQEAQIVGVVRNPCPVFG